MADYTWPNANERGLIGQSFTRRDGPVKSTGKATYSQDVHRPGMLYGKILWCPHAHAKITSIDVSAAEAMPGVKAISILSTWPPPRRGPHRDLP